VFGGDALATVRRRARQSTRSESTRRRVLDAAANVFREKGYTAARLSDIAEVADTRAGSLYYHFDSREDLVREMLMVAQQRTNEAVRARVDQLPASASSVEVLQEAFRAHLESVLKISDYTAATLRIVGQVPQAIRSETLAAQWEYGRYWRDLFERAQGAGVLREGLNLSVCRLLVLGGLNSTTAWFQPGRGTVRFNLPQLEALVSSVFLEGIATEKGRARQSDEHRYAMSRNALSSRAEPASTPATKAEATRARVLDAAAQVFRTSGYAEAKLSDIASLAGLQTGSLYYHFGSREEMVIELIHDATDRIQAAVRRALGELPSSATPLDSVATAMSAHLSSLLGEENYGAAMLKIVRQVPKSVADEVAPRQRSYMKLWSDLLKKGTESGEIRNDLNASAMLMLIMGAMNSSIDWYDPDHFVAVDRLIYQNESLLFDGMLGAASFPRLR
jgi:TetR/AcrR family transcriptional regulator, cholesterol catabolism regulator